MDLLSVERFPVDELLSRIRKTRLVGFNGGTAAKLYQRHVIPTLTDGQRAIATTTLSSTSPAHAGVSFAQKAARWSGIFGDRL